MCLCQYLKISYFEKQCCSLRIAQKLRNKVNFYRQISILFSPVGICFPNGKATLFSWMYFEICEMLTTAAVTNHRNIINRWQFPLKSGLTEIASVAHEFNSQSSKILLWVISICIYYGSPLAAIKINRVAHSINKLPISCCQLLFLGSRHIKSHHTINKHFS
jgi:hypothetical protein